MRHASIARSFSMEGVGLFTGAKVSLELHQATSRGIRFIRKDLPGSPSIVANLDHVSHFARSTILGNKECSVATVEHFLAAAFGAGITDLEVWLFGPELPILDGSARPFYEAFLAAGRVESEGALRPLTLSAPIFWSEGAVSMAALPAESFSVTYLLSYPKEPLLCGMGHHFEPSNGFLSIASARTFALEKEIEFLLENGLLLGASKDAGLVIGQDKIAIGSPMRYDDEPARHKVVDLLGDFFLLGRSIRAHIIAVGAGHAAHVSFGRKLLKEERALAFIE